MSPRKLSLNLRILIRCNKLIPLLTIKRAPITRLSFMVKPPKISKLGILSKGKLKVSSKSSFSGVLYFLKSEDTPLSHEPKYFMWLFYHGLAIGFGLVYN